jgi:tetratricopeptide (TPR) repeat protein
VPTQQAVEFFEQGLACALEDQVEEAAELFREAIEEDQDYPEALYNLACCCALLGLRDEAVRHLDLAVKLDPDCRDWAEEDEEFDSIRDDEMFIKVLEQNDPFRPTETEVVAEPGSGEPSLEDVDGFEAMHPDQPESVEGTSPVEPIRKEASSDELPPCAQCGALVKEMRLPRFDPFLSLSVIGLGVGLTIALAWLQYIHSLLFGIPITSAGLWMFTRVGATWVCQNCGARGEAAGQPPPQTNGNHSENSAVGS